MKGAGNGGGAQGKDIHLSSHLLQVFLMGDAKA
ncbi:unnamed protein product, partial [marine sediment metagenome]